MPFDPARFEAEVALDLIPTEKLPAVAQDALEAGFDGPHVVRMAILEPEAGWAIDQALPLAAWILVGWAFSSWRTATIGFIVTVPVLLALSVWGVYWRMKVERRDLLLRWRVPDYQI
jgi:hypothetical protein